LRVLSKSDKKNNIKLSKLKTFWVFKKTRFIPHFWWGEGLKDTILNLGWGEGLKDTILNLGWGKGLKDTILNLGWGKGLKDTI